jgi:hypothetical protein
MLATETAANVISLEDYRRRRIWPDPPRPGPIGGCKAKDDALLAEVVIADAAERMRNMALAGWR